MPPSLGYWLLVAVLAATPTPTPTPTAGVASERGLASFAILLVLIGATLLYLRRRGGT